MLFRCVMAWMVLLTLGGSVFGQESLRVVTLNLWHGREQLKERTHLTQELLAELQPDLVGLQEVSGSLWRANRARLFAHGLDYDYAYHSSDGTPLVFAEGLAVMSRHRLQVTRREKLKHSNPWPFERRFVQWTKVTLPSGQPFMLLNTHLTHHAAKGFQVDRLEQALQVIEVAARHALARDIPAVLVGDLNSSPSHMAIQALTGRLLGEVPPFQDAWVEAGVGSGMTSSPINPYVAGERKSGRVDYVMVLQGTTLVPHPLRAWRIADGISHEAVSDHYGIAVDLRMETTMTGKGAPTRINPGFDGHTPAERADRLLKRVRDLRAKIDRVRALAKSGKEGVGVEAIRLRVLQMLVAQLNKGPSLATGLTADH